MQKIIQINLNPKLILAFAVAVSAFTVALKIGETKAQT